MSVYKRFYEVFMASNLVTLAEYKAYAGITSPNLDAEINSLIPKVSALVKNICRRTFVDYVQDAKTEVFNGGYAVYNFKEYPVISVQSVEYSTDYGQNYSELVEFTDYAFDPEEHCLVAISGEFPKAINGYRVTYNAGYETIPEDLKLAILDLITYYIKNEASVHSNKTVGSNNLQIEYISTTNLPTHIKRVLDLHTASFI